MTVLDFLGVASGGGLFGIVGAIAKGFLEIRQHKARVEEKKVDYAHQIELTKLKIDQGTIEGEAKAFAGSQDSSRAEADSFAEIAKLATTRTQRWLVLVAAVWRYITRTSLTWGAHVMAFFIFFTLTDDMKQAVLLQVFAMASTYGGWWFGSRAVFRFNK